MGDRRVEQWGPFVVAALGPVAAALALVPWRASILNANVALVLMAVVVAVAVWRGGPPAAAAAVTAALAFDFMHTEPYWRFSIDARNDVETTVLLLVVGLIVGHVAARGWRAAQRAELRSADIRRVYRIANLSARGDEAMDVIMAAQAELMALLDLRDCQFEAPPFERSYERLDRSGLVAWPDLRLGEGGLMLPTGGVELLVVGRGQLLGRFVCDPASDRGASLDQRIVAVAIADQVGAALAAPSNGENRKVHG